MIVMPATLAVTRCNRRGEQAGVNLYAHRSRATNFDSQLLMFNEPAARNMRSESQ